MKIYPLEIPMIDKEINENSDNNQTPPLAELQILRLPEVKQITGLGRTCIYQMMADDMFPRSVSLSPRAVGWRIGDIKSWLLSRETA
jgi:prophage regulatory protein